MRPTPPDMQEPGPRHKEPVTAWARGGAGSGNSALSPAGPMGQWKDPQLWGWGRGASPPAEVPAYSHELEGQARPALKPAADQLWVSGVHF